MKQTDEGVPVKSALDGVKPEQCIGTQVTASWPAGDVLGKGITTPHDGFQAMGKRVIELQQQNDAQLKENNRQRDIIHDMQGKIRSLENDLAEAEEDIARLHAQHEEEIVELEKQLNVERNRHTQLVITTQKLRKELATAEGSLRLIGAVLENQQSLSE